MTALFESYSDDDLKSLRNQRIMSDAFARRIIQDILNVTSRVFREELGRRNTPSIRNAMYSLPFRYALCSHALMLSWAVKGGHQTATARRLSSDFIDATYASYATFFDGLITLDKKLDEIFNISRWMLHNLFLPHAD